MTEDEVKLNLGAGGDIKEGYTNVDKRDLPGVDVVCDFRDLPHDNGSVDEILAKDCIEHVGRHETLDVLSEWRRVLKDGGKLTIKCPNLHTLADMYLDSRISGFEFARKLYGNQRNPCDFHQNGFDPQSIRKYLSEAGFEVTNIRERLPGDDYPNMLIKAKKVDKPNI